jgi:hypothetical protein
LESSFHRRTEAAPFSSNSSENDPVVLTCAYQKLVLADLVALSAMWQ